MSEEQQPTPSEVVSATPSSFNIKKVMMIVAGLFLVTSVVGGGCYSYKSVTTERDKYKQQSVDSDKKSQELTKQFEDYKKQYSQDITWVKEVAVDKNGRPLLDGKGNALYNKRMVKKTDINEESQQWLEKYQQSQEKLVSLTTELDKYKKTVVEKRGVGIAHLYATPDLGIAGAGMQLFLGNLVPGIQLQDVNTTQGLKFENLRVLLDAGYKF